MKEGEGDSEGEDDSEEEDSEKEWCRVCDRCFSSAEALAVHISEHIVCGKEGCTYTAHASLVQLHIRLQHSTGLYKRIKDSTQSIEQWREQRKKNFPTKEIVEMKKARLKEMEERGERLQPDNRIPRKHRGNKRRLPNENFVAAKKQRLTKTTKSLISTLPASCLEEEPVKDKVDECFSDGEWCEDPDVGTTAFGSTPPLSVVNTSLLSLMSNYDSDNDSDNDSSSVKKVTSVAGTPKTEEKVEESDGSEPEEAAIVRQQDQSGGDVGLSVPCGTTTKKSKDDNLTSPSRPSNRNQGQKKCRRSTKKPVHLFVPNRQTTLLEKLLKDDILRERNHLLQCVRFIVENNFFNDKNQASSSKEQNKSDAVLSPSTYSEESSKCIFDIASDTSQLIASA